MSYSYKDVKPPQGEKISIQNGVLKVPDHPILPFIEGDGTGPDIWRASVRIFDAAVAKALGERKKSPGSRSTRDKRPSTSSRTGCRTTPSRLSGNISWASRGP